jgi:hypothetical protein
LEIHERPRPCLFCRPCWSQTRCAQGTSPCATDPACSRAWPPVTHCCAGLACTSCSSCRRAATCSTTWCATRSSCPPWRSCWPRRILSTRASPNCSRHATPQGYGLSSKCVACAWGVLRGITLTSHAGLASRRSSRCRHRDTWQHQGVQCTRGTLAGHQNRLASARRDATRRVTPHVCQGLVLTDGDGAALLAADVSRSDSLPALAVKGGCFVYCRLRAPLAEGCRVKVQQGLRHGRTTRCIPP